jgi:hypothetical protein
MCLIFANCPEACEKSDLAALCRNRIYASHTSPMSQSLSDIVLTSASSRRIEQTSKHFSRRTHDRMVPSSSSDG